MRRAALALVLLLPACGDGGAADPAPATTSSEPAAAAGLVLRVEYTGGFVPPAAQAARLPMLSIYADGRVISEGPVAAIHPGPALPNLQVQQIEQGEVQDVVDRALAAGVAETGDLGSPPVADVPSTRFTVVTADRTYVREVYALSDSARPGPGVTPEQQAARDELAGLVAELSELALAGTESYEAEAVAALAFPWTDPGDGLTPQEQAWPGPPLPGEPLAGPLELGCVTVSGDEGRAVLDAAATANASTPWTTGDGARWSVTFRPLLPDESGCADLID